MAKSNQKPKGAKKPETCKKNSTQATKRGGKALQKKPSAENVFAGATEISVTENKIAVTKSTAKSVNGKYFERTVREYHERTPENMRAFQQVLNDCEAKKVTVQLKAEQPQKKPTTQSAAKKSSPTKPAKKK